MAFIHTTPWALYNEIDEFAAAWLEQLIAAGHIAKGVVDRRSIVDIQPYDLRGFRQVHLFAGIGVWSYSFRRAGITDDTEAWSASCPCQPFSSAGSGTGMDDERHLWPHAHHLIRICRPSFIAGEQVASKDGLAWLDLVQADMEGTGYAFGAVDTCAAGFGAPHIRQRQYWFAQRLADTASFDCGSRLCRDDPAGSGRTLTADDRSVCDLADVYVAGLQRGERSRECIDAQRSPFERNGQASGLANGHDYEQRKRGNSRSTSCEGVRSKFGGCGDTYRVDDAFCIGWDKGRRDHVEYDGVLPDATGSTVGLAHDTGSGWREQRQDFARSGERSGAEELEQRPWSRGFFGHNRPTGPTNGFWSDVDWLFCRDGKWRPVEPGTFPLAHGAAARVGRLRGYGNAINAEQAIGFLEAYLESTAIEIEGQSLRGDAELAFEDLI